MKQLLIAIILLWSLPVCAQTEKDNNVFHDWENQQVVGINAVLYYAPVLLIAGVVFGVINGLILKLVLKRTEKLFS